MSGERNLWSARLATDLRAALVIVAALAVVPAFVSSPYWLGVLIVSIYFALLALGWNLLAGFTGQFSLAPRGVRDAGRVRDGAARLSLEDAARDRGARGHHGHGLLGFVLGRIVLRLQGPYLALTTLSFAEIARVVIGNSHEFTRGDQGLNVPALTHSRVGYYYIFLAVLLAVLVALYFLMRGRAGRFWLAIRDDSTAPRAAASTWSDTRARVRALVRHLRPRGIALRHLQPAGESGARPAAPDRAGDLDGGDRGHGARSPARSWARSRSTCLPSGCDRWATSSSRLFLLVIVFARFFRTGLWGIATGRLR
jgi:hypothetical protein